MKQYIGTKMVMAEPALRVSGPGYKNVVLSKEAPVPEDADWIEDGYKVVYEDGYESWSPRGVFEEAYRETSGMPFGLAIEAAKKGKKIARAGWNGKGQYVELGRGFSYNTTDGTSDYAFHQDIGSTALVFVGTRGRQVGWLASQADMLAADWMIVG